MKKPHQASRPGGPKHTPPKRHMVVAPMVTDHALVRYLQRAMGVDVEAIREMILSPETKNLIHKLQDGNFPIGAGLRAVVRNGHVVTIK